MPPSSIGAWGLLGVNALAAAISITSVARAGGPLGDNGSTIETSSYAIDISQGPVLGGARLTGLGGAYVAIAEDVDGDLQNPAAPAVRPFYSIDWFDWWPGLGLTLPALADLDYFNTGERDADSRAPSTFLFLTPALNLQWGSFGVGMTAELQNYSADAGSSLDNTLDTSILTVHGQFANSFMDGQLVAGLGTRVVTLALVDDFRRDDEEANFKSTGSGPEIGVLVRPNGQPFRLGASFRGPVDTQPHFTSGLLPNENGDLVSADDSGTLFYYPSRVTLPWDLNVGAAFQFGRPLNPRWRSPGDVVMKRELKLRVQAIELEEARDRELERATSRAERSRIRAQYREKSRIIDRAIEAGRTEGRLQLNRELAAMPRYYILVTGSLVITGIVEDAVGMESYFDQQVRRSGEKVTFSPRLGIETEAVPDLLKLRVGSYLEHARAANASSRGHVTFGFDFRLFRWDVLGFWPGDYLWRIGLVADVAPRYATWGISIGGWYPRHRPGELPPPNPAITAGTEPFGERF
ncbi:MAG TPA: hypothetical protein VI197_16120 [Polyangiaceae bacterium]